MAFQIEVSVERLRLLGSKIRKDSEFTSEDAKAFLQLYGEQLKSKMEQTLKDFLQEKLG